MHQRALDSLRELQLRDLMEAPPPSLRENLGLEFESRDGVYVAFSRAVDHFLFNRVGVSAGASDDAVAAALDRIRSAGVTRFFVQFAAPPSSDTVERHAIKRARPWVGLAGPSGSHAPASSDVSIVRASPSHAPEVGSVLSRAMALPDAAVTLVASVVGRPRWHVYVATEDDRAIGVGALFVHDGAGYLGMGATLPEHRKRGVQSALLARRLEVARDLGCSIVVSETGAPVEGDPQHSHRNMLRLGLREISTLHNFMPA